MPMETVLICLLLLYNAWLVSYILSGRQRKSPPQVEDKPPSKPPHRGDDIVGKSRFKNANESATRFQTGATSCQSG